MHIPSTKKKKKKNLPILVDRSIQERERRSKQSFGLLASPAKVREKERRHTLSLVPRRNKLIGTDGFRDHEGAGTQNRFPHERSINHPLLRNANAKYTGWDSAVRATGSHMCSCMRCVSVCGTPGAATLRRCEHDQEINTPR